MLRAATDAGVNHIDTAEYYGPGVVNELIREALFPYPAELALVSKVAARRDDSGAILPYDEPEQLRAGIEDNLATPVVTGIAAGCGVTPAQVALAWLLAIADNVLLIPGTSSRGHLRENLAAGSMSLDNDEIASLSAAFGGS